MSSVGFLATHWRVILSETEEQILPLLEDVGDLVVLWIQQTHICVRLEIPSWQCLFPGKNTPVAH